jgi:hypothetical protein
MKARWLLAAAGAAVVVGLAGALATRDAGKHDYYPPPSEVWVNIEISDGSVQETVLWNPATPAGVRPETFSCVDPSATPLSTEDGEYKVTRSQDPDGSGPLTVACDASPLVGEGGVENVRILVGSAAGQIDVLEADPAPGEGQPVIWRLSAQSPVVAAVVAET